MHLSSIKADERHYNYYVDNNPLATQIELLNKLENMGRERDDKRILTTMNFGVPVTSILLLMKEAKDKIENLQENFYERQIVREINDDILMSDYKLHINSKKRKKCRIWRLESHCEYDEQITVSGSGHFISSHNIYPEDYNNIPLSSYLKSNDPKISVEEDHIEVKGVEKIPLIEIYKATIQFHEFSYVLHERIKQIENEEFKKLFIQLKLPKFELKELRKGKIFDGNLTRRIDIVHKSYFGFSIDSDYIIKISKNKLTNITEKGLEEAIIWVNSFYGEMLKNINRK